MEKTFINEYPDIYINIIREVDKHSNLISCSDRVINKVIRRINRFFEKGRGTPNSFRAIQRIIRQEIHAAFFEKKKEHDAYVFSSMLVTNDYGESVEFEPKDLLAQGGETVLKNISLNEKIARLATDDRELVTLSSWAKGLNDSQVSETLARHFGGKSESHRKFVRRFKVRCQERLEKECLAKNLLIKTA